MPQLPHGYDFDKNILSLSQTQNIADLPNEWVYVHSMTDDDGHCICNRSIKHISVFVNTLTGNTIQVGTTCYKKLKLKQNTGLNPILTQLIKNSPGSYINIYDTIRYSESMRDFVVDVFDKMIKNLSIKQELTLVSFNMIEPINIILEKIKTMLEIYKNNNIQCAKLEVLYKKLNDFNTELIKKEKIYRQNIIEKEKQNQLERQRQYEEQMEKARIDWEKQRQEHEKHLEIQRVEHEKQVEKRRIEKEEDDKKKKILDTFIEEHEVLDDTCKCGLNVNTICMCLNSKYTLVKANRQYYCDSCNKWKDRC